MVILELLIIMILPAGILWLASRVPFLRKIGAVALCYLCGFLLSLLPVPYDRNVSQLTASVVAAAAIPLILFGFDLRKVRFLAKDMIKGYALQIAAVILCVSAAAVAAGSAGLPYAPQLGGMAAGLYTGGTPNLIAVGSALLPKTASAETITAANSADFIAGGIYFLLMLTVLPPVYRRFLGDRKTLRKAEPAETSAEQEMAAADEYDYRSIPKDRRSMLRLTAVILLAGAALAAGAGLELLINGNLNGSLYIIITVSVLGIAGSLIRPVRETKGSYQVGQYMVLVFSLGLSMSVDLSSLAGRILPIILFLACVRAAILAVHLLLCKVFRIDGGTALITNIAGVFGPPFIAPVAGAYGRRVLISPGIICAVAGLVIGNFIGIGVGSLLSLIPGI